ncbi:MAG: deoxyribose-phosphate aldolase [Spirochaetales bacterium]|nr:deoxyribose-phosphate aldolase [Spirochaetales bacterium]MCF7937824.1 deoxyribose-phosphate aldolase [Spirochaetales bacterium]
MKESSDVPEADFQVTLTGPADAAAYIDHTLLKPNADEQAIDLLCREAVNYGFASVCVNSFWAGRCAKNLGRMEGETGFPAAAVSGGPYKAPMVCSVVGFPLGAMETASKAYEASRAASLGADEIDMVINIGALKSGMFDLVREDIAEVVKAAEVPVKVILETVFLSREEKVGACLMAVDAGAAFVKTSTGFAGAGATAEDVYLMRKTVGRHAGVKAAGGVRSYEDALDMFRAGANRLGASSGVAIISGKASEESY